MAQVEEHTEATRLFRNYAGGYRQDGTEGSDMAAVSGGWASITPLGLRSDMLFKTRIAHGSSNSPTQQQWAAAVADRPPCAGD